jgi:cytoskeleton protein RodZ
MLAKDAEGAEPAASLRPLVLIVVFAIAVAALVWAIRYYAVHRQAAAGTTTTVGPAVPGAPAAVPSGDASQPAPSSSSLPAPPSAPSPLPPASGAAQSGSAAPQPAATPAPDAAATAPAAAAGSSGSRATSSTAAPAPAAMPPAVTPSTATAPASASAAGRAGGTPSADAAGASGGTLSLSVTKNCWVHIEDADGKLLLSRMAYPGNRFQLSGHAPYAVFLGYAPGVDLEYDGKPVDVSAHQRSNSTARLTVPAAAAQ